MSYILYVDNEKKQLANKIHSKEEEKIGLDKKKWFQYCICSNNSHVFYLKKQVVGTNLPSNFRGYIK